MNLHKNGNIDKLMYLDQRKGGGRFVGRYFVVKNKRCVGIVNVLFKDKIYKEVGFISTIPPKCINCISEALLKKQVVFILAIPGCICVAHFVIFDGKYFSVCCDLN